MLSVASRVLARFGGLAGLGRADYTDLCREKGLSEAKACQLLAAMELGRRFVSLAPEERPTINSPQDVANLLGADMATLEQEHLRVVLLNTRNAVLSTHQLYVGTVNHSVVRGAEVFRPAIRENAPALIVVHNHPSGDPTPQRPRRRRHSGADRLGEDAGHRGNGPHSHRKRQPLRQHERIAPGLQLGDYVGQAVQLVYVGWTQAVPTGNSGARSCRRRWGGRPTPASPRRWCCRHCGSRPGNGGRRPGGPLPSARDTCRAFPRRPGRR